MQGYFRMLEPLNGLNDNVRISATRRKRGTYARGLGRYIVGDTVHSDHFVRYARGDSTEDFGWENKP